jgi:hypothetical protein
MDAPRNRLSPVRWFSMTGMKPKPVFLLLGALLIPAVPALATVLPESCGKDEIKFEVKIAAAPEGQASPDIPPPEAGKAQIVFIEAVERYGLFLTVPSTRFAVDGQWVGANRGDSHFAIDVMPGEHNVCVNWQSDSSDESKKVGMDKFTAEAGKVYYYQVAIKVRQDSQGWTKERAFDLTALSAEQGRYRARASGVSTSKPKK